MLGCPSTHNYIKLVKTNQITNCSIMSHDICNAETIFGPNLGSLKRTTINTTPEHFVTSEAIILRSVIDTLCNVKICVNVMHVNKIPFLVTVTCRI